ncbi:hypothetical protein K504DRAFT_462231 [Pleomassaria siparia CBS 279.74]|uniref:DUF3835 domain-containing protein n=1 Tax=Pleomassaria siparia CBS 279.74 TaxID=1314801 RepID=A0A6G1KMM1_9PLEO|nr:hypothetical protein K504DRAFT_462231 [Pleomassaria siparia CBS 279.74]
MATTDQDPIEGVDRRLSQLEESVAKLRQSLEHWQTWEVEYEMLKEEIENADAPSPAQITEIGRDLGCSFIKAKEIEELLGKGLKTKRTANQVVDMISKRVDYVRQNISTVQKQLDTAEKKLGGASVLLEPDMENEEGLPLFDIQEELDEEGNVVSSNLVQPGKAAPEIVEALRKTGIKKSELEGEDDKKMVDNGEPAPSTSLPSSTAEPMAPNGKQPEPPTAPKSKSSKTILPKKSVSFAEDTKPGPTAKPVAPPRPVYAMPAPDPKPAASTRKSGTLETSGYNESLADYNFTRGTKVIELDDDDNVVASYPIIPQDESPESAELRRQMLQYGLSEVGAVVAEMDLERPTVDYSGDEDDDVGMYDEDDDDDDDDDYDHNEDSEDEEDEDEYGRNTRPVLTEDYKKKMLELEKKLNARMMENVGPREDVDPLVEHADDVRTLKILKDEVVDDLLNSTDSTSSEVKKKDVRFADSLDVSSVPQPVKQKPKPAKPSAAAEPTMADTIVERSGSAPAPQQPASITSKPGKISRFKSAKTASAGPPVRMLPSQPVPEPQPFPTGPLGRTLATEVVEKPFQNSDPQAPDEFDPAIVNRQIQAEYHKLRNTMINRQGGFMPTEDEKEDPLMEERNGKPRKVSRFMAARLRPDKL